LLVNGKDNIKVLESHRPDFYLSFGLGHIINYIVVQ